jgi:glucan phosphorylase
MRVPPARVLATVITDAIGDGWIVDLDQLQKPRARDKAFRAAIRRARREAKCGSPAGSSPRRDKWSTPKFSSDRTIAEYARDIWHAEPCPVEMKMKEQCDG